MKVIKIATLYTVAERWELELLHEGEEYSLVTKSNFGAKFNVGVGLTREKVRAIAQALLDATADARPGRKREDAAHED